MEYTYTDSYGSEETVSAVRVEKDPLVYFVPSTFSFRQSTDSENSTTDWYFHENGGHLSVQRYFLQFEGNDAPDGYTMLSQRAEEIPTCIVRPAKLQSGFSMITYEEPSDEGEHLVRYCCELCDSREALLAVVLFASTIHLDDLNRMDLGFYSRVVKEYARMTQWLYD